MPSRDGTDLICSCVLAQALFFGDGRLHDLQSQASKSTELNSAEVTDAATADGSSMLQQLLQLFSSNRHGSEAIKLTSGAYREEASNLPNVLATIQAGSEQRTFSSDGQNPRPVMPQSQLCEGFVDRQGECPALISPTGGLHRAG